MSRDESHTEVRESDVAIVGAAAVLPQSPDLEAFWGNLRAGNECIRFFSREELEASGVDAQMLDDPRYVPASGAVDGIDLFDAEFFGFSPREAEITDPQHRLLLETCHSALRNAGRGTGAFDGPIGVYAGMKYSTYLLHLLSNPEVLMAMGESRILHGNDKDYLASWISYKLGLTGPSVTVQTACSTSLVAVHLAVQGLLSGDCDMALAGGVSFVATQRSGYRFQEGDILSPDGHCRSYDASAAGTVGGNGVGVVVLRRAVDAIADRDPIRALIRGSALNNDGAEKLGYTAPSIDGQAAVVAEALAMADVEPASVDFIEGHGTATVLGDPVEVAALNQAFRGAEGRVALGSVKSNIGHLDAAAGIAGLLKAMLALEHGEIPPSLHSEEPSSKIDFAGGPFEVCGQLEPLSGRPRPWRGGVSSFGIGGTNAHVVLEEAPAPAAAEASGASQLLVVSAATEAALDEASDRLAEHVEGAGDTELADLAFTLKTGGQPSSWRRAVVAADAAQAVRALKARRGRLARSMESLGGHRPVAFLFPGQGSQYPGMLSDLYPAEASLRATVDEAAELLATPLGFDLRELLLGEPDEEAARRLRQTAVTQPALFVVEVALARLWMEWGVVPEVMLGHSLGEYSAACVAGVFDFPDALAVVAERGRLMQAQPAGAMLSLPLTEPDAESLISGSLALAAINGTEATVVSGPVEEVEALAERLAGEGVTARRLETSHAFHSPAMEPVLDDFREVLAGVELRPAEIPVVSNLTGGIVDQELADPDYWLRQMREPVRFADGLWTLLEDEDRVLLEVGPGAVLSTLTRRLLAGSGQEAAIVRSLPPANAPRGAHESLLEAQGELWKTGVAIDWSAVYRDEERRRVPLPAYPFQRQSYWIALDRRPGGLLARPAPVAGAEGGGLYYAPSWAGAPAPAPVADDLPWLVLLDGSGVGRELCRLRSAAVPVATVESGDRFERLGSLEFRLDPAKPADVRRLFEELDAAGHKPGRVVLLVGGAGASEEGATGRQGFDVPVAFFELLAGLPPEALPAVDLVSIGLADVTGQEELDPAQALALGPLRAARWEIAGLRARWIDLEAGEVAGSSAAVAAQLAAELARAAEERPVALRGGRRWVGEVRPLELGQAPASTLPAEGVFLITGGTGGVGLEIAEQLAARSQARLVLLGRAAVSIPDAPAAAPEEGSGSREARLASLSASGAEVMTIAADVTDRAAMAEALGRARERFGRIDGVVHAAGVAGGRLLALGQGEESDEVLRPKVEGIRVLDALLADDPPALAVAVSSLTALTGALGQSAYTAANLYLDAFAAASHRRPASGLNWQAFDFSAWRDTGMAAREIAGETARERDARQLRELAPEDGREAFLRAVGSGLTQVVISTTDPRMEKPEPPAAPGAEARRDAEPSGSGRGRPAGLPEYAEPRNGIESTLVEIWQEPGRHRAGRDPRRLRRPRRRLSDGSALPGPPS